MPKQRMAGYVPLKGAPAETEPAPAPAQDTTTAAPAPVVAPAAPVAPTASASALTPLSARRRMAGYVPFAREAEWLGGAPTPAAGSTSLWCVRTSKTSTRASSTCRPRTWPSA